MSFHAAAWTQAPKRPPWRKLLYIKQGYPDNYVDETFLEKLQKNGRGKCDLAALFNGTKDDSLLTSFPFGNQQIANVRQYEYWSVVLESTLVAQHISSIVIFVAVFVNLYKKHLGSHALITYGTSGTAIGYIFWEWNNAILMPKSQFQSNDGGLQELL